MTKMVLFNNIEEAIQGVKDGHITWEKLLELKEVYDDAYKVSREYGYVGVGCITWACRALQEYQGMQTPEIEVPTLYTDEDFT
jgi:hypothetical protein